MNPSVHPDVREALTKEVERRSIKTGKKISLATLKADKFYDRAPIDACDKNWVHIAEHREFWRECVVKAAKFHYNYRARTIRSNTIQDQRRRRSPLPSSTRQN